MLHYHFSDICIACSFCFPELNPLRVDKAAKTISFEIDLAEGTPLAPFSLSRELAGVHSASPSLCITDKGISLTFPSFSRLLLRSDGYHIECSYEQGVSTGTIRHLILDQFLPRVLAHRNQLVLHAATIDIAGCAIALLGESGRGKSTLSAFLDVKGYSALGDDCTIISTSGDFFLAWPSYPSLRLFSDSLLHIGVHEDFHWSMGQIGRKVRFQRNEPVDAVVNKLPLAALFLLASESTVASNHISARRMSPREACMAIMANSFQLDVTDVGRVAKLLAQASDVANRVPIYELSYPRCYERLPEVLGAILSRKEEWCAPTGNSNLADPS